MAVKQLQRFYTMIKHIYHDFACWDVCMHIVMHAGIYMCTRTRTRTHMHVHRPVTIA